METPAPRFVLNRWLQLFLTIIAGTIVAVIAWTVLERFAHILILLLSGLLIAFLLAPLVDRLEQRGLPRVLGTLLVFLALVAVLVALGTVLLGPLISQLQAFVNAVPQLVGNRTSWLADLDSFFRQNGIPLETGSLQKQLGDYLTGASSTLLGGTLSFITGVVGVVTDLLFILVIGFYISVDGQSMRNHALRLLPSRARERWFFVEATLNSVLGGYIRGQILVAVTVGAAAGAGSALLGVHYPLVIGLLAFLFEFIPLIGPVLGMIPAVVIALFQPFPLVLWVVVYFILLQQVESNLIVPRISGEAVGLHPLAAMLALLAGVELGGLGGALIAVPVVGVLYLIAMALYADATHQTGMLMTQPRRRVVGPLQALRQRGAGPPEPASPGVLAPGDETGLAPAPLAEAVPPVPGISERLNTIAQEQAALIKQFDADSADAAARAADAPPAPRPAEPAPPPPDTEAAEKSQ